MSTTIAVDKEVDRLSAADKRREVRRVVLSSYLGSTIEYYDFLLYTTASALVFPNVFFAELDPVTGVIASYLTFAAGYVARPLGGAIFGHFGDRLGRKRMLILSMFVMGIASTLIGVVPGGDAIGVWGAMTLLTLRLLQGIALGGEWGGAALMALEHSEPKSRGFAASFVNAGGPSGAALGTFVMGAMAAISGDGFLEWGWRVAFLLSALLLVIGLIVRSRVSESPIFKAALAEEASAAKPKELPLWSVVKRPKNLLLVMLGGAAGFALQVVIASFAVSYAVSFGLENQNVLYAFAGASICSIFMVIGSGRLSDKIGRRPLMLIGMIAFMALIYPMFGMLASGNTGLVFLAMLIGLFCHSTIFGPLAAFISEQFGTTARYTGASVGYQMATLLGAGFTPSIISAIYGGDGNINGVAIYLGVLTAISAIAILLTRESKDINLETYEH